MDEKIERCLHNGSFHCNSLAAIVFVCLSFCSCNAVFCVVFVCQYVFLWELFLILCILCEEMFSSRNCVSLSKAPWALDRD